MNDIEVKLKQLIIETLNLEDLSIDDIASEEPLFGDGDGLNLDSIDALELGLAIKKQFNVLINGDDPTVREHFASVATLTRFIKAQQAPEV
ncbi:phosphopantetheine-binding protein [Shewanella intestini]|uniref:Acyl carrier protein n=1 Tax=Shewanella intestini TaxID=2017544 RepID=A0ABS5I2R5_9GAMM|nr:phosphopantetheine-binding protein [Shewanella sp. XMDDZSB0408]MBR9728314.1 acyl carrier protein [Shewanella intestini]MRG35779.1 acyl carrier protein [Shewanella sp. XMDDZSB0408]